MDARPADSAASPRPPETFDALRAEIRNRFENLSPHLQRIGRLALDQPNEFALQTVAALAAEAEVQPSTLIRFAKEFGFGGFRAMQQVFKMRLIEGAPMYRERVFEATAGAPGSKGADATIGACADAMIASLEHLKQSVSQGDFDRAVELLHSARHIYVAGLRRAHPIAAYFAYGMNRLERRCSLLDYGGGMATQQVANMGHEDLLFAASFPPYSSPVVDVVRDAHFRELPIVALTDTPSSPLARSSTVAFFVDTDVTGQFRPISGAIGLVQALIVGLSAKL